MTDEELIAWLLDAPADGLGTKNLCLEAAAVGVLHLVAYEITTDSD